MGTVLLGRTIAVVPVIETAETYDRYHLCKKGDVQDGGKAVITGGAPLGPRALVFFSGMFR